MTDNRVVITGAGVISPLGMNVKEFWDNCLHGVAVAAPIPEDWARYSDFSSTVWAPLPDFEFSTLGFSRVQCMQTDPVSLLALFASREAVQNADLQINSANGAGRSAIQGVESDRAGVYMGTGIGGAHTFLKNHDYIVLAKARRTLERILPDIAQNTVVGESVQSATAAMQHPRRVNPFVVPMLMPNAVSANLGLEYRITGPNLTYSIACSSGTVAVGKAYNAIRNNEVDFALSGGAEYLYDDRGYIFRGFDVAGTLAQVEADISLANRPFDECRSGFLFSEGGAGVVVLESLERATARGAPIMAEIIGYAESFDAHSMMRIAPDCKQIIRMIEDALKDAEIPESEVDYVNAHGTGTELNDKLESEALWQVFGPRVCVNSTKSLLGHTIGASGAIEVIVTALSLRDQTSHICKNLENPISDLNYLRTRDSRLSLEVGLSHSFAFGGHNSGLVLRRYSD